MLKMVLYQYLKGNRSPAGWEQAAQINDAMRWLGRGYTPSRRTWYDFRDRVGGAVEQLHQQLVKLAINEKHLDPTVGALDGTSVAACASRHRMVNQETLRRRREHLEQVIDTKLPDGQEPAKWVPASDPGRLDLAQRMQVAEQVLEQRIAENAARPSGKRKDPAKIQVSLTDPEAPLGRDKLKTFRPMYTVQSLVDPVSHMTVCYMCNAATGDSGMLAPMIDQTQQIVDGLLQTVLADGSYCSILDVRDALDRNVDLLAPTSSSGTTRKSKSRSGEDQIPREEFTFEGDLNRYICPQGHPLEYKDREKKSRSGGRQLFQSRYQCTAEHCDHCPLADRCLAGNGPRMIKRTEGEELLESQREKMDRAEVKSQYRLRGQTVERIFGDAKGNRGVDRFHGRGLRRARAETGLLILAQNLLRLDKLQRDAPNPNESNT